MVSGTLPCATRIIFFLLLTLTFLREESEATRIGYKDFSALQQWGNSGLLEVWTLHDEYIQFRCYALSILGQAHFLDILLGQLAANQKLRIVEGFGAVTGYAVEMATAAATARVLRSATENAENEDESSNDSRKKAYTLLEVLSITKSMIAAMLVAAGPIARLFRRFDNVLLAFIELDKRFLTSSPEKKQEIVTNYFSWEWDLGAPFWTNYETFEQLVQQLQEHDCDKKYVPDSQEKYKFLKQKILDKFPSARRDFDWLELKDGPAEGTSTMTATQFDAIVTSLQERYVSWIAMPRQAQAFASRANTSSNRDTTGDRNSVQPSDSAMNSRTMHPK
jgi:hypothetical protein